MEDVISAIFIFGLSTVKFLMGIAASITSQQGLWPSYVSTVGGGILGVFVFTFAGELINKWYYTIFPKRKKRLFSKLNRFLVHVRKRFGLPGIAFLTPILSVPIGIFLAMSLSKNKWRISFFMIISFLLWSTFIFVPYYLFDINISELIINSFSK